MENVSLPKEVIEDLFSRFIDAEDCPQIVKRFKRLVKAIHVQAQNPRDFYCELKSKLQSWKCKTLWELLDKRANQSEYGKGKICEDVQVLVIGAGPIGLRTAIEVALLGAQVVVVEKRTSFSRNNVLHLWPFLLTDFRSLGAKRYYGKFCSGTIEHISIRRLQAILLKTALIFGVKVFTGVTFDHIIEPTTEEEGWKCKVSPAPHPVTQLEIDVVIGADGKKNVLPGFKQIEMRGTLAIGITANFINHNNEVEKNVEEISGIAYHFNPKFFDDLRIHKNIRLENIVYYKDETHYFVMTALKSSLVQRGVLKQDLHTPSELLAPNNVNCEQLQVFVSDVVEYATKGQLHQENLEYKITSNGQKDVAVFDFTSIKKAESAARIIERKGSKLLVGLVGDSLLEPFWPTGSGCARGVLSALDAAWMVRSFSLDKPPLQILSERESIYKLLSNTDSGNLHKNYAAYTINPNSRYMSISHKRVREVYHLYDTDDPVNADFSLGSPTDKHPQKGTRYKIISTHAKTAGAAAQKKKAKLAMQLSMGDPAGRLRTSSASSVELLDDKPHKTAKKALHLPPRGKRRESNGQSGESDTETHKIKKKQRSKKFAREKDETRAEKPRRKSGKFFSRFGRSHKRKTDNDHESPLANGQGNPALDRQISRHGLKGEEVAGKVTRMDRGSYAPRKGSLKERELTPARSTKDIIAEMEQRESTVRRTQHTHKPLSSIDWQRNGEVRSSVKRPVNEETAETPPNKTVRRDKLIDDLTRISPRARLVVPVIRVLSPDHKKKENESILSSMARGVAMLALAAPLLADRTINQRPTSFTGRERQALKSGLVRDVVSRYNSLNREKPALRRTESSASDTPLKRPLDVKDGRPHSKVLSYSSSTESLKRDLLDMRSEAQRQRLEEPEKRDSEDSGFRSINGFDADEEQNALKDIGNKDIEDRLAVEPEITRENKAIEKSKSNRVKSAVYQKTLIAAVKEKESKEEKVGKPEPKVLQVSNKTRGRPPVTSAAREELDVAINPSDPMASTLDCLVKSSSDKKTESSLRFMIELFRFIQQHPHDEKYRRVYKRRSKFKKLVWNVHGAKLFMAVSGWMEMGSFILLPKSKDVHEPLEYLSRFLSILNQKNELNQTCPNLAEKLEGLARDSTPPSERRVIQKSLSTSCLTPGPSLLKENKPPSDKHKPENKATDKPVPSLPATDRRARLQRVRETLSESDGSGRDRPGNESKIDRDERIRKLRLQLRAKGLTNSQRRKKKSADTSSDDAPNGTEERKDENKTQKRDLISKGTTQTSDKTENSKNQPAGLNMRQNGVLKTENVDKDVRNVSSVIDVRNKGNLENTDSASQNERQGFENRTGSPRKRSFSGVELPQSEQLVYDLIMDDPRNGLRPEEELTVSEETSTDSEIENIPFYRPTDKLRPQEAEQVKESPSGVATADEIDALSNTLDDLIDSLEDNSFVVSLMPDKRRTRTDRNPAVGEPAEVTQTTGETRKISTPDEAALLCDTLDQMLSVDGSEVSSDQEFKDNDSVVSDTASISSTKGGLCSRQSAFRKPLRRHLQKPRAATYTVDTTAAKASCERAPRSTRASSTRSSNLKDKQHEGKRDSSMNKPALASERLNRKSKSSLSTEKTRNNETNEVQVVQGRLPDGTIVELSRMTRVRKLNLGRQPIASNERAIDVDFKRPTHPPPLSKAQSLDRLSCDTTSVETSYMLTSTAASAPDLLSEVSTAGGRKSRLTETGERRKAYGLPPTGYRSRSGSSASESNSFSGRGRKVETDDTQKRGSVSSRNSRRNQSGNRPSLSSSSIESNKRNSRMGSNSDVEIQTRTSESDSRISGPKGRRTSSTASDSSIKEKRTRNTTSKDSQKQVYLAKQKPPTNRQGGRPPRASSTGSQDGHPPRTSSTGSQGGLPRRTSSTGSQGGRPSRTSSTGSHGGRPPRTSSTGSESSIRGKNRRTDHEGTKKRTSMVSQNTRSKNKLPADNGLPPKAAGGSKNKRQTDEKKVTAKKEIKKTSGGRSGMSDPVSLRDSSADDEVFVADTQGDVDFTEKGGSRQSESSNTATNPHPKVKRWLSQDHPLAQLEKNSNTAPTEIEQAKLLQNDSKNLSKNEPLIKRNGKVSIERKSSSDSTKSSKSQESSSLTLQERKQMLMQLAAAPPKIKAKPVNQRRSILQLKNRSGGLLGRGKKYTFEKTGASAEKDQQSAEGKQVERPGETVESPKTSDSDKHRPFLLRLRKKKSRSSLPEAEQEETVRERRDNLFEGSLVESPQNVSGENAFEFRSPGTYVRKSTINGTENVLNDLPVLSPTSDGSYVTSDEDLSPTSPSKKTKHRPFGLKFGKKKRSPEKSKQ